MLTTLRIDPDAPQDWAWDGTRYTAPSGVIEPYTHPMTEHAAVGGGVAGPVPRPFLRGARVDPHGRQHGSSPSGPVLRRVRDGGQVAVVS